MGWLLSIVLAIILYAVVVYIVGRLGLGLTVGSFTDALIAGAVIAIVAWAINWLLVSVFNVTLDAGLLGAILSLIVAAIVLVIADRCVMGKKERRFVGAIIGAIAIAVVAWLIGLLLNALGWGINPDPLAPPALLLPWFF